MLRPRLAPQMADALGSRELGVELNPAATCRISGRGARNLVSCVSRAYRGVKKRGGREKGWLHADLHLRLNRHHFRENGGFPASVIFLQKCPHTHKLCQRGLV